MTLTIEQVRHVAHLARLALTPEEEEKFARQLGQILGYVERLQSVNVDGIEPLAHAVPISGPERADVVHASLPREVVLAAAPKSVGEGVAVPKMIE
jgi:aspartyl-tRNA(Asn)/glutamyl-tRNA(Gln) amidotransferase subunit C